MENINTSTALEPSSGSVNLGHLGVVVFSLLLLLGMTWLKQPQLFSIKKSVSMATNDAPKYYAYVQPAEDAVPLVAGASTNDGPSVINEDGSVSQVDMGEVLGAATEGVVLSLDDIKIKTIPDSFEAAKNYFLEVNNIENKSLNNAEFETALSSNNQNLINQQAQKLTAISEALQKVSAPTSLAKLHKLKIVQFNSTVGVLENFTQADNNPELVGKYLQEFLKSQEDLDSENALVAEKFNLSDVEIYNAQ